MENLSQFNKTIPKASTPAASVHGDKKLPTPAASTEKKKKKKPDQQVIEDIAIIRETLAELDDEELTALDLETHNF